MGLSALAEIELTAVIGLLVLCCNPGLLVPHLRAAPAEQRVRPRARRHYAS